MKASKAVMAAGIATTLGLATVTAPANAAEPTDPKSFSSDSSNFMNGTDAGKAVHIIGLTGLGLVALTVLVLGGSVVGYNPGETK